VSLHLTGAGLSQILPATSAKQDVDATQASIRSLRKLGCERGHDDGEVVPFTHDS